MACTSCISECQCSIVPGNAAVSVSGTGIAADPYRVSVDVCGYMATLPNSGRLAVATDRAMVRTAQGTCELVSIPTTVGSNLTVAGDSGTPQTVTLGETLTIRGALNSHITVNAGTGDALTIDYDLAGDLGSLVEVPACNLPPGTSHLVGFDSGGNSRLIAVDCVKPRYRLLGGGGGGGGGAPGGGGDADAVMSALNAHINDATAAHAASAISLAAISGMTADDVQEGIAELNTKIGNTSTPSALSTTPEMRTQFTAPILIPLSPETGTLSTTGTKWTGRMPFGMKITEVRLSANSPSTTGHVEVDIVRADQSIFTTRPRLDVSEKTSLTASVAAVFSDDTLAKDEEFSVSVTATGSGVIGLKAWIIGTRDDTITPTTPVTSTVLVDESFGNGGHGDTANTTSTTANSVTGSNTLTHSDTNSLDGDPSLYLNGNTIHYLRWENPTHTTRYGKWYYVHGTNPPQTAWILYIYAGNGTDVAYRIGIDAAGRFVMQNGTTGTTVTSTHVLTAAARYRIDNTATGSGEVRIAIYTGSNINATSEVGASDVRTLTTTSANFSDLTIGLMNTLTGGGAVIAANLTDEGFNGSNGVAPTNASDSAVDYLGTGTLTYTTSDPIEGAASLRVNGTASHYGRWNYASHNVHHLSIYMKYITAPGGATMYFYQVRNGANTATAFQVGIQTDGRLRIRNAVSGTGDLLATATTAFTSGSWYRIEVDATGGGTLRARMWTGSTIHSVNTSDVWQTVQMVGNLTETNFSNEHLGNISGVTTAMDLQFDRMKSSDTAMPSPLNYAGGNGKIEGWIERYKSSTATMPANYNVPINPGTSIVNQANLAPTNGCWWGAATPPNAPNSHTGNQTGLTAWMGFARRRPDILHWYKTSTTWSGVVTDAEKAMLEPVGAARAIPFYNWKIRGSATSAEVVNGVRDNAIITWAKNIELYPYKVLVCLDHEFDNNNNQGGVGNTNEDNADMHRHVIQLAKANGAKNVLWVWTQTGYSGQVGSNASQYNAMWPGDDVIDWIGWDPYFQSSNRTDFRLLINENIAGTTGWTGMYNWGVTPKTVGVNGLRYTFGGKKPLMLAEWGTWFTFQNNPPAGNDPDGNPLSPDGDTDLTDSQAADRIRSIQTYIDDYPALKALVHYNDNMYHLNHIDGGDHPLSEDAFGDVGEYAWLNVGTNNAP